MKTEKINQEPSKRVFQCCYRGGSIFVSGDQLCDVQLYIGRSYPFISFYAFIDSLCFVNDLNNSVIYDSSLNF